MSKPEDSRKTRVTAPTLTLIHTTVAILLRALAPLPISPPVFMRWFGLGLAASGFLLGVLALIEFKRIRAGSDLKKASRIFVTSGVYRFTRNPIYLGFVFILIGLPLNMGTYWGLILVWPLIIFINNLIIKHEEAYLEQEFKGRYTDYVSRVRRWL